MRRKGDKQLGGGGGLSARREVLVYWWAEGCQSGGTAAELHKNGKIMVLMLDGIKMDKSPCPYSN